MVIKAKAVYLDGIIKIYNNIEVVGLFDKNELDSYFEKCRASINYIKYNQVKEAIQSNGREVNVKFLFEKGEIVNISVANLSASIENIRVIKDAVFKVYECTSLEFYDNINSRKQRNVAIRRAISNSCWAIGFTTDETGKVIGKDHATVLHNITAAGRDMYTNYKNEKIKYEHLERELGIKLISRINAYNIKKQLKINQYSLNKK